MLKLQAQGKTPADVAIPDHYVLGTGHMKFFYDKISWLKKRYTNLACELIDRKFDISNDLYWSVMNTTKDMSEDWFNDYRPAPEDIYLNMVRLCKRSNITSVAEELYQTEFL